MTLHPFLWMILQQDEPCDFVIGTSEDHSVRELCETAFSHPGLDYQDYVVQDPKLFRPVEAKLLVADKTNACHISVVCLRKS